MDVPVPKVDLLYHQLCAENVTVDKCGGGAHKFGLGH